MANSWEVIYKALADFASVQQEAAKTKAVLLDLKKTAEQEGQAEVDAATKSAAAHDADTAAINRNRTALEKQAAAAKTANEQTAFGGRSSMQQHLSDLDQEKQKKDLLNRAEWGGFTSPQQAEAFRQQVYQQTLLRNRAGWQGYSSPDQYLNYLDQEKQRVNAQVEALKSRNAVLQQSTGAYLGNANAVRQAHESLGTLGTTGVSNVQGYQAALAGLPDEVVTKVTFADADALKDAAAYDAIVHSAGGDLTTHVRIDSGSALAEIAKIKAESEALKVSQPVLGGLSPPASAAFRTAYDAIAHQQASPAGGAPSWSPAALSALHQATLSSQPHGQVANDIRSRISAGEFQAGSRLPTRTELGVQYGVSTGIIDRALALLKGSGEVQAAGNRLGVPRPLSAGDAASSGAASVQLGGKVHVLSDIKSIKAALADLSTTIAHPQVEMSPDEAVGALKKINEAYRSVQGMYKGSGLQPEGSQAVGKQLAEVQAQAGRAFPALSQGGGASADEIGRKWSSTGEAIKDVFRSVGLSVSTELDKVAQQGGGVAARISAAFSGLSSGGGGIGTIFGNMAQAAAASGGRIVSAIGPMIVIFTTVIQLLPALVAGFGALSTVFAAMPQMVVATVSALAILKMAIGPVLQALQAYGAVLSAQQNMAANPLQTAMEVAQQQNAVSNAYYEVGQAAFQAQQSQVTNAHSVMDAQFALKQAVRQASMSQIEDAHNVRDAQFAVGEAYYTQKTQAVESAMSISNAQHTLADAVYATSQAQYQLNIAWQTAREDLASLELQVQYAATNQRGAQLALMQAQQNYAQVMANSNATALDRAQAVYQIKAAEEALAEVEQQNKDNETKLGDVRKYGINQVFGVTQAQHALTDAEYAQIQAQKQLMLTQRQAANAQITAAHEIKDAVFALWEAQKNQANDAIVNAHNVEDAQFSLSQAYVNQKEGFITGAHDQQQAAFQLQMALDQMAIGLPGIASAESQFADAMYRLGPAARTAVTDLIPLAKWFDTNKSVANSFFKEMLPSLSGVSKLIGPLGNYLNANARELGHLANEALTWFEKLAHSPAWRVFTGSTVQIIDNLGHAVGHVVVGVTDLAKVAVPFTEWLSRGIDNLAAKFEKWAADADKSGSNFRRWLTDVRPALDDIDHVLKAIVDGFAIIAGGPMGSSGSLDSLHTFETLMRDLAKEILPDFFEAIHALTRPEVAAALGQLFVSLANLILAVVNTPGFQVGFNLMVRGFITLADVLSRIMDAKPVADILGVLVGLTLGLGVALAALKFTGILTLITHFRQLVGYAQQAYSLVSAMLTKMSGGRFNLPGAGGSGSGSGTPPGDGGGSPGEAAAEDLAKAAADLSSAASDLASAAGDLKTSSADLDTSATTTKTAAADLETSASDLDLSATDLKASSADLDASATSQKVAAGDLETSSADLDTSATDLTASSAELETSAASGGGRGLLGMSSLGLLLGGAFLQFATQFHGFGGKTLWELGDRPKTLPQATPATPAQIAGANNTFVGPGGQIMFRPGLSWKNDWAAFMTDIGHFFRNDVWDPVAKFFTTLIPDWLGGANKGWNQLWDDAYAWFFKDVIDPVKNFFGESLPNWLGGSVGGWSGWSSSILGFFTNDIWDPVKNFFTNLIPDWLGAANNGWSGLWQNVSSGFVNDIWDPVKNFFTNLIPDWLGAANHGWSGLWQDVSSGFTDDIWDPVKHFFTGLIPDWLGAANHGWAGLWQDVSSGFHRDVVTPVADFFTKTMPSSMENAFKSSMNWVITNVVNKAIGFINDVTHVIGVPQIAKVQTLAAGGHVLGHSVSGSGDLDSAPAMLTPGEFVIRKGARMALQAKMGPDFLPALNLYDQYAQGGPVMTPQSRGGPTGGGPPPGPVYRNPLRDIHPLTPARVDMGVDYIGQGNVYAVGAGQIESIAPLGWPGKSFIAERLSDGQYAGKLWYAAENIAPKVGVGQKVDTDTVIGYMYNSYPFSEWGWAASPGFTEAAAHNQQAPGKDPGERTSAFGYLAAQFLHSLGAPMGIVQGKVFGDTKDWAAPATGILGILEGIGGGLSKAGGFLGHVLGLGSKGLLGLASRGAEDLFNVGWDKLVMPLSHDLADPKSAVGALMNGVLTNTRQGVDKRLGTWDSNNNVGFNPKVPMPRTASVGREQAYARSLFPQFGWNPNQLPYLIDLWNLESGWSPIAQNPTSTAYGIAQFLDTTWAGFGPKTANPELQIRYGEEYIKQRWGDPASADRNEHDFHWYFKGGDVISAVKDVTKVHALRESMLYGAMLQSDLNPDYSRFDRRGAWGIDIKKGHLDRKQAENPYSAARLMLPRYEHALSRYGIHASTGGKGEWFVDRRRAMQMASDADDWDYAKTDLSRLSSAWQSVLYDLGDVHKTKGIGDPTSHTGGTAGDNAVQRWHAYAPRLADSLAEERTAVEKLLGETPMAFPYKKKKKKGGSGTNPLLLPVGTGGDNKRKKKPLRPGSGAWEHWYSMKTILEHQGGLTYGSGKDSAWKQLWEHDPSEMTEHEWRNLHGQSERLRDWMRGTQPVAHQFWEWEKEGPEWSNLGIGKALAGHVKPNTWAFEHLEHDVWRNAISAVYKNMSWQDRAKSQWQKLWGPGGSLRPGGQKGSPTPGPGKVPAGAIPQEPSYYASILAQASLGGPAAPGSFAQGGSVGQLAGLFHFADGGEVGADYSTALALMRPGAAMPSRSLSEAAVATGAASNNIGLQFNGNINVHNPVPERASDSISHSLQRQAMLAGRGGL